jgi:hypothetical protein
MNSTTVTPTSSPSLSKFRKRSDSVGAASEDESTSAGSVPMRRSQTIYSPIVSSMIQSNSLRDCQQIQSMMLQCQMDSTTYNNTSRGSTNTGSGEPFVCRTAKKYHAMCLSGERL